MAKKVITEEQVINHIRTHMDLRSKSYVSHVLAKHVKIPEKTKLSKRAWLGLNFYGLPDGITAKACRYDALNHVFPVSRFVIFLSKREQYPFYLENAYPVFDQD